MRCLVGMLSFFVVIKQTKRKVQIDPRISHPDPSVTISSDRHLEMPLHPLDSIRPSHQVPRQLNLHLLPSQRPTYLQNNSVCTLFVFNKS
eukprot:UN08117